MTDEVEERRMKKFMDDQVREIEIQKWLEGERRGCDPGQEFVSNWIAEHAREFRDRWREKEDDEEIGD